MNKQAIAAILGTLLVLQGILAFIPVKYAAAPLPSQALSQNPVVIWNHLTSELGIKAYGGLEHLDPPRYARAYALVHVAIYDALLSAHDQHLDVSEKAVAAGAASKVLTFLFPDDKVIIKQMEDAQTKPGQGEDGGKVIIGLGWGHAVGQQVVNHAKNDGSDAVFPGPIPTGDCIWSGVDPVEPMAGTWKTYILTSGAEFQPERPYPCGSDPDLKDVKEVLDVSLNRTPEQIAIVHKWADQPPPTVWGNLLNEEIESKGLGIFQAARAHAYLNVAMYDAFVSCWLTKYTYWEARPFMRISDLVTVITTPNFPSYTSGHSTISGAASLVMSELFPKEKEFFAAQAEEATMSRLLGGIHFHHDDSQGLVVGREIGEKVVHDMRGEPHTFVFRSGQTS